MAAKFWEYDIVVRTTDYPRPLITEGGISEKGLVGMITEVVFYEDKAYYRLNNGFLYDDTEIRKAREDEKQWYLEIVARQCKNLVDLYYPNKEETK